MYIKLIKKKWLKSETGTQKYIAEASHVARVINAKLDNAGLPFQYSDNTLYMLPKENERIKKFDFRDHSFFLSTVTKASNTN